MRIQNSASRRGMPGPPGVWELLLVIGGLAILIPTMTTAWASYVDWQNWGEAADRVADGGYVFGGRSVYGLEPLRGWELFAAYGHGDSLHVYDSGTGQEVAWLSLPGRQTTALSTCPDGQQILAGYEDGTVALWPDITDSRFPRKLVPHEDSVTSVALSHDGQCAASTSMDSRIHIWDVDSGRTLHRFEMHAGPARVLRFTNDDRQLISGGFDGSIRIWNVQSGESNGRVSGHRQRIHSIVLSPDDRIAVSCGLDRTIRAWELSSGRELWRKDVFANLNSGLACSPDGRTVATGGTDAHIHLRNLQTGHEIAVLTGHRQGPRDLSFSPDGRTLFSCSLDGTIRRWDVSTRSERLRIQRQ